MKPSQALSVHPDAVRRIVESRCGGNARVFGSVLPRAPGAHLMRFITIIALVSLLGTSAFAGQEAMGWTPHP